jgi:hypothetical protein
MEKEEMSAQLDNEYKKYYELCHAQFSIRHTDDRDVHIHHVVSRCGNYFLSEDLIHEQRPDIEEIREPDKNERE